ncbi:hypothetical protein PAHAL_1G393500 [Panicum hallii]|jgi:hypothetical protein|uniref:Uncharacterized protein n=1 Tax=Panicum hallii TaxID=206008 RepID=A0A2T8KXP3_9POAL|nr:hypothetical protein PAHAL_1G393500 [Panicum hallii]
MLGRSCGRLVRAARHDTTRPVAITDGTGVNRESQKRSGGRRNQGGGGAGRRAGARADGGGWIGAQYSSRVVASHLADAFPRLISTRTGPCSAALRPPCSVSGTGRGAPASLAPHASPNHQGDQLPRLQLPRAAPNPVRRRSTLCPCARGRGRAGRGFHCPAPPAADPPAITIHQAPAAAHHVPCVARVRNFYGCGFKFQLHRPAEARLPPAAPRALRSRPDAGGDAACDRRV